MINAKLQDNRTSGSGKDAFFKGFYHISVM